MRECDGVDIGATLFVPASHKNLHAILTREKYKELKSIVIDFEDGLEVSAIEDAIQKLEENLHLITNISPFVFLRPKDPKMLLKLLQLQKIEHLDGFVLPKFSLNNADEYLQPLAKTDFKIMPSIEGEELFNNTQLQKLRDKLLTVKTNIVLVRFGLEDMLKALGMRRGCDESIFDFAVTNTILGNFLAIFKSVGFMVSGGVYPCFKDNEGFICDIKRDLKEGLFGKTIIHPNQIKIAHELYKVTHKEYVMAQEIAESNKVVFSQNEMMAETLTMLPYSKFILKRAKVYGIS